MIGPVNQPLRARIQVAAAFLAVGSLVFTVLAASSAFACIPQPLVLVGAPGAGNPGDKLTVRGVRFAGGTIELRWNAIDGPLLATASSADFAAEVTIPPAAPGVYVVVVFARGQDGNVGSVATAPVVVSGPTVAAAAAKAGASSSRPGPGVASWALLGASVLLLAGAVVITVRGRKSGPAAVVASPSVTSPR